MAFFMMWFNEQIFLIFKKGKIPLDVKVNKW